MKKVYEFAEYESDKKFLTDTTQVFFGTEYEIEDIKEINHHWTFYENGDVKIVEDHSLRNNGREFITKPLTLEQSLEMFKQLHSSIEVGQSAYSSRTSIHVHVNVLDLSLDQLKHLLLLYAYLEPVFFSFVGEKRKHNIHCVPLNWTLLPKYYPLDITGIVENWSKYTAFNMCPVFKQGTVEFRHLYGTGNFDIYKKWLNIINNLFVFVRTTDPSWLEENIQHLSYDDICWKVLKQTTYSCNKEEIKQSEIDVKLSFL